MWTNFVIVKSQDFDGELRPAFDKFVEFLSFRNISFCKIAVKVIFFNECNRHNFAGAGPFSAKGSFASDPSTLR